MTEEKEPAANDSESNPEVVLDATPEEVAQLREHVTKLESQNADFLRHLAEYQTRHNEMTASMKRLTQETDAKMKYAHEKFATDILICLDNLVRAVDAAKSTGDKSPLSVGVSATLAQIGDALKRHGIVPIESKGQPFDPNKHQAVQTVPAAKDREANTVADVLQQGYTIHDKVLRPAMVAVAQ
jgi:molecular chaperone GrpE